MTVEARPIEPESDPAPAEDPPNRRWIVWGIVASIAVNVPPAWVAYFLFRETDLIKTVMITLGSLGSLAVPAYFAAKSWQKRPPKRFAGDDPRPGQ